MRGAIFYGGGGGGGFVDELEKSENSSNIEGTRILKKVKKKSITMDEKRKSICCHFCGDWQGNSIIIIFFSWNFKAGIVYLRLRIWWRCRKWWLWRRTVGMLGPWTCRATGVYTSVGSSTTSSISQKHFPLDPAGSGSGITFISNTLNSN